MDDSRCACESWGRDSRMNIRLEDGEKVSDTACWFGRQGFFGRIYVVGALSRVLVDVIAGLALPFGGDGDW